MKHSFIRFVGGLISFFGIAEVVTGMDATASTICEMKSNDKVTTYALMTDITGARWYVLWGDYNLVTMGGSATQSLYHGELFQTPAYPGDVSHIIQSVKQYCVTAAPADYFYAISGLTNPILRPGCANRLNTHNCGYQLYFENTGLAKDFGCCYSGTSTGTTGASGGSSGYTCRCWYTEASSGNSYWYNGTACNIVDVKPIKKCYEFINCEYGYYHSYSGMSKFCMETVPGMLYDDNVTEYGSGECEIPPIQYQDALFSNSNGTFNYRRCLNDGCTTTGYIENAKNFSVFDLNCKACPSGMADVSNILSSTYSDFEMHFPTTSTIERIGGTGVEIMYETHGRASCQPSNYTATDKNGNSFVVGGCSTYNN